MLILKLAIKELKRRKVETLVIVLLMTIASTLYMGISTLNYSIDEMVRNYARDCYGDVLILGYIPLATDSLVRGNWVIEKAGFAIIPSVGSTSKETYPLLLAYSRAIYQRNITLGGIKAKPIARGEALLVKEGKGPLKVGMTLTVRPLITFEEIQPFKVRIVGTVLGGLPLPAGPVLILSPKDGERLLEAFGGYTVYIVKSKLNKEETIKRLVSAVKEAGGFVGFIFTSDKLYFYPGKDASLLSANTIKSISTWVWIMSTIIILLIAVSTIERNVREMALLKVLGTDSKQTLRYLLYVWGLRGFFAFVISVLLSWYFANLALQVVLNYPKFEMYKEFMKIALDMNAMAIGALMIAITSILAILLSFAILRKMNVVEAIYFYGMKLRLIIKGNLALAYALSYLRSYPVRALTAILAFSLAISVVMMPLSVIDSLSTLHINVKGVTTIVLRIPIISPGVETLWNIAKKDLRNPSLWYENLYGSTGFVARVNGKPVMVDVCLRGACWSDFVPKGDKIMVSSLFAHVFGVKVGDKIKLTIKTTEGKEKTFTFTVGYIKDDPLYPPRIMVSYFQVKSIGFTLRHVFVIKGEGNALRIQRDLIESLYAAVSKSASELKSELREKIGLLSQMMVGVIGITALLFSLSIPSFVVADESTRARLLKQLKLLGFDSLTIMKASLVKWTTITIPALLLYLLILKNLIEITLIERIREVYLVTPKFPDAFALILALIALVLASITETLYFKTSRP